MSASYIDCTCWTTTNVTSQADIPGKKNLEIRYYQDMAAKIVPFMIYSQDTYFCGIYNLPTEHINPII